jgi:hypothetical protein
VKLQIRLSQFLEQRGVPSEPVLSAIIAANAANPTRIFLGVSTRSPRIDVQLRYTSDGLAAIAPAVVAPAIPPRALLRVITEGKRLRAALVIVGTMPTRTAVDELMPGSVAARWHEILEALPAGGKLNNRTRYLTESRSAVAIEFPARDAAAEAGFVRSIDALATRIGLSQVQRAAFAKLHPMFAGAALSVSTECTPAGPAACLRLAYASYEWDLAINLTKAIAPNEALRVGSELGKIAGELSIDDLRAIELVFDGSDVPDIVCWMQP